MLVAATPVYELFGVEGIKTDIYPEVNTLVDSPLGYFVRPGKHSIIDEDWEIWLDYCDRYIQ